jgi:hypothetical protein
MSLKSYDMVVITFLYIIILLYYVNKLNSSMSNFGGRLGQPKKINCRAVVDKLLLTKLMTKLTTMPIFKNILACCVFKTIVNGLYTAFTIVSNSDCL